MASRRAREALKASSAIYRKCEHKALHSQRPSSHGASVAVGCMPSCARFIPSSDENDVDGNDVDENDVDGNKETSDGCSENGGQGEEACWQR